MRQVNERNIARGPLKTNALGFSQFCRVIRMMPSSSLQDGTIIIALSGKKITMNITKIEETTRRSFHGDISV